MNMMKKYSIVIPAYNAENYISKMIVSIKAQTYSNWELIIIDDGSKDKTGQICDEYLDEKTSVFHIENKGQIAARIEGILKCKGDYTLVVDADDYLEPVCLQEINEILSRRDYDCVVFPYSVCDENLVCRENTVSPQKTGELTQKELLEWVIETQNHPLYNKMIKTSIMQEGVKEAITDRVSINGDYALIVPIICHVLNAYYFDKSLYKYRILSNSISHNRKFQQVIDTDYVTYSIFELIREHGLLDSFVEEELFRTYLYMISMIVRGVRKSRYISKGEINRLHRCVFYQMSEKYENEKTIGRLQTILLKSIRMESVFSCVIMNTFLCLANAYSTCRAGINYNLREERV